MKTGMRRINLKEMEAFLKEDGDVIDFFRTGSSVICSDRRKAKDIDYVALIEAEARDEFHEALVDMGFTWDGERDERGLPRKAPDGLFGQLILAQNAVQDYPDKFRSYRIGRFNLIVSPNIEDYILFRAATEAAKCYSSTGFFESKENRVNFFKAIRQEIPIQGRLRELLALLRLN